MVASAYGPVPDNKHNRHRHHQKEHRFLLRQHNPRIQQRSAEDEGSSGDAVRVPIASAGTDVPDDHAEDEADEGAPETHDEVEDLVPGIDGETGLGLEKGGKKKKAKKKSSVKAGSRVRKAEACNKP
jgi:hypothetical protein